MDKRSAQRYVDVRTHLTFGDLKEMLMGAIMGAPDHGGISTVNSSMTRGQALNILVDAIRNRRPDERVHGGSTPTRDTLIATNVVRECLEDQAAPDAPGAGEKT